MILCLWPYIPTAYSPPSNLLTLRQDILKFKDGKNAADIASRLINNFDLWGTEFKDCSDWILAVVPASKPDKTVNRFRTFTTILCESLGFQDGFGLITNKGERPERHLSKDRNSIDLLEFLSFTQAVSGKKILLFDDIFTTGKSFSIIANKLHQMGAANVTGLFLGQTYWPENNNYKDLSWGQFNDHRTLNNFDKNPKRPRETKPFSSGELHKLTIDELFNYSISVKADMSGYNITADFESCSLHCFVDPAMLHDEYAISLQLDNHVAYVMSLVQLEIDSRLLDKLQNKLK